MLRIAVLAALTSLVVAGFAAATPTGMRTIAVVKQGARHAPARYGTRDCIAYPRSCVNGAGRVEVVYLVSGHVPARPQLGTVLTDTNCQADSYGVSHCMNRIRLANGRMMTVRHDHSMMNDPCLAPGEHVRVVAA
jgi:hypothetical protein